MPFLAQVHRRLAPRTYLEIGVGDGHRLALASCRSVGVDPDYAITAELDADVALIRTPSDEWFGRPDPLAATGGVPFDLCLLDGPHLIEYALRDLLHAERHSSARGMIICHDLLPRTAAAADRERHTRRWSGDAYSIPALLAAYRPDLVVVPVGTEPTGVVIIVGLDPASTVLVDHYEVILAEHRHPDPQPVPDVVLDRLTLQPPHRLLESGLLELLGSADPDATAADLRDGLRRQVRATLGPGYLPDLV